MPELYIIATPIGNLEDISQRALRILNTVDLILCEDTRITKKLLNHYKIIKPTISYHHYSRQNKIDYILKQLKQGKKIALVSDAGTPGISDPGNELIEKIVDKFGNKIKITPIPGPCASTAALSISGLAIDKFLFLGFLPHKKKRQKFLQEIIQSNYPTVFYESPYRILKTLNELSNIIKNSSNIVKNKIIVCRELTKKFETIYRGDIENVIRQIKNDKIKGEFTVIVQIKAHKNNA